MSTEVNNCKRHKKQAEFLAAYAACGNISAAAKLSGVGRATHYSWLRESPGYQKQFDDASDQAIDSLEAEARRRAVEGNERPVFHKGVQVGAIREFSDVLLIFLLKAARPEKYRERSEVANTGERDVRVVFDECWFGNQAHERARDRDEEDEDPARLSGDSNSPEPLGIAQTTSADH